MRGPDLLLQRFASAGTATAIVERDGTAVSYSRLADRIGTLSERFERSGIGPGTAVQLVGDFGAEDIAWLVALWVRGAIVAPVAPTSMEMVDRFAEIGRAAFVARPAEDRLDPGAGASDHELYEALEGRPGLVIFSSGTTGTPKGVVHSVDRLLTKFAEPGKAMRTIGFLLFDHISGLDTTLYTLAAGGTLICLPARDPSTVCDVIERERAEVLPTAPTFLNLMMIAGAAETRDLSSLRIITYGGEMMPQGLLERAAAAFPGVRMVQKYGASEIGALRSKSEDPKSRWLEFSGADCRVVDGLLEIRTTTAMLGYLNAPSPFTEDGWYRTGDRVEVDGQRLRFLGREGDLISVGGQKVYPAEVEAALHDVDGVLDAVVYGQAHPMLGHAVCARIQVEGDGLDAAALRTRVRNGLKGLLEPYKIPHRMEFTSERLQNARFKNVRR